MLSNLQKWQNNFSTCILLTTTTRTTLFFCLGGLQTEINILYTCTCSKLLNKGKLTVCWSTVYHKLKKTNMIDTCDDLIRLLTPLFVVFLSGLCSLSFQAMKPVLRYILWKRRFLLFIYMCTLYLLVHVCGLKIDLTCSCLLKYSV